MSGQSNGSRSHPRSYFIRFTVEEDAKLAKLLRKRGLTAQAFLHAASMRALNEAQLGKKTDAEARHEEAVNTSPKAQTPRGLGIREQLQTARDTDDDFYRSTGLPRAPSPQAAPQAAPQARTSSVDDEVLALARTIVESPASARRDVLRSACRVLARGRTLEEAQQLADDLDTTIKRLDGTPQTALERVRARMNR
jgi:hypothetical protein